MPSLDRLLGLPQQEPDLRDLTFGGSYPVTTATAGRYTNSYKLVNMSEDVLNDFDLMINRPSVLHERKTNKFYYDIRNMREEGISDDLILEHIQTGISKEIYGESIADYNLASPYANQIVESFLDRSSFKTIHDAGYTEGEQHFTLMPGKDGPHGRSSSVCADTACAIFTGAGMINYLPWEGYQWASNNDYIIDALEGKKKGDKSYLHWDRVGQGSLESSLKNVQQGDWIIIGQDDSWLTRERGASGKHSMVILDVTENGILMGSGNATEAEWEGADTVGESEGIETRFYSFEALDHMSDDDYQAKVFRFNPKNDQFVHFENEIFSHQGGFDSAAASGEILRKLMY